MFWKMSDHETPHFGTVIDADLHTAMPVPVSVPNGRFSGTKLGFSTRRWTSRDGGTERNSSPRMAYVFRTDSGSPMCARSMASAPAFLTDSHHTEAREAVGASMYSSPNIIAMSLGSSEFSWI